MAAPPTTRRLFGLVAAVVLVDTMFYAAVTPLLPDYRDALDLSKSGAGLLAASYPAGTLLGALPGGWLAARFGVKPTLLLGLVLLAVTSLAFGFAEHIVLLDLTRFVQGFGGACTWAAGLAWLVSASPARAPRRADRLGTGRGDHRPHARPGAGRRGDRLEPRARVRRRLGAHGVARRLGVEHAGRPPAPSPGLGAVAGALRRPAVMVGFWLFTLPAVFAGTIEVLAPLRLDDLGASGATVGAIFLVAAAVEAVISPLTGRLSDRRGRLAPIRVGLGRAVVMAMLLPLPETTLLAGAAVIGSIAALGMFWAPAMALLSDASEAAGLDQGLAFALANLAWAAGHLLGAGGGGGLADATTDALPYALLGIVCAATLAAVVVQRRGAPARAPAGR